MSRWLVASVTLALSLACGGGAAEPDLSALSGRWCAQDTEVGCYRFEGSVVHEEEVVMARGRKLAAEGTWSVEDGLLVMRFGTDSWVLDPVRYSDNILILHDHSQGDTFTFVRQ